MQILRKDSLKYQMVEIFGAFMTDELDYLYSSHQSFLEKAFPGEFKDVKEYVDQNFKIALERRKHEMGMEIEYVAVSGVSYIEKKE